MSNEVDITGNKYNMLTAIKRIKGYKPTGIYWLCECECKNKCIVKKYDLVHLKAVSCGCYARKASSERNSTHKMRNTKLYCCWVSMKQRCYNPNHKAYKNYGARGITVCDEWKKDFQSFYNWSMSSGYSDGLSIDRKNNDKGYSPDNCRWSTSLEQQNNRRGIHQIKYNGETHSIAEWSRITGIPSKTISRRIFVLHIPVDIALTKKNLRYEKQGA